MLYLEHLAAEQEALNHLGFKQLLNIECLLRMMLSNKNL